MNWVAGCYYCVYIIGFGLSYHFLVFELGRVPECKAPALDSAHGALHLFSKTWSYHA